MTDPEIRSRRFPSRSGSLAVCALALGGILAGCNNEFDSTTCASGGRLYKPGDRFPAPDGCNSCSCGSDGQVACTLIACTAPPACTFDSTYTYGVDGGLTPAVSVSTLAPPQSYTYQKQVFAKTPAHLTNSCSPALPACGDPSKVDAGDIIASLSAPFFQSALLLPTPLVYGVDRRPVDGTVFQILRSDGHGIAVGDPCPRTSGPDAGDSGACVPIAPYVETLVDQLRALDMQQLMDPSCAAIP